MRMDTARDMSGDVAMHLRTRSRGVSDPWGRGVDQPAGPGRGSLTPRLRYSSGFPGRHRPPADARAAPPLDRAQLAVIASVRRQNSNIERFPESSPASRLEGSAER